MAQLESRVAADVADRQPADSPAVQGHRVVTRSLDAVLVVHGDRDLRSRHGRTRTRLRSDAAERRGVRSERDHRYAQRQHQGRYERADLRRTAE